WATGLGGIGGPNGLRVVLYDKEIVSSGQLQKSIHIGTLPEKVDRYYGPGPGGNGPLDSGHIDVETVGVHIHQYRDQPQKGDHLHGGGKGEIGGDHLVPGL